MIGGCRWLFYLKSRTTPRVSKKPSKLYDLSVIALRILIIYHNRGINIYYSTIVNQSGRYSDYGPFFKAENEDMDYDAGMFWQRFKELSRKDLPVILKTSIKQSTISMWRHRKNFPRADEAVKIAETLHTTVEFLVTGRDIASSPCTADAMEIAVAADKLDAEGKRIALTVIKGLETQHPLGNSGSTMEA
jgi:hypothetical protein